jgi:VanZ family protein
LQQIPLLNKTVLYFFPAISWLIISTYLLTLPGSSLPNESWMDKVGVDKWVHIAMFFILVTAWCRWASLIVDEKKLLRVLFAFTLLWFAYGVIMEFVQLYFISNRSFDIWDVVADAAGCIGGAYFSYGRYIKK